MIIMRTNGDVLPPDNPLIVNRISDCRLANANNSTVLSYFALTHLVIHRTDLDTLDPVANPHPVTNDNLDGPALAGRFADPALGTGKLIPYHFLLRADTPHWTLEQILPLSLRGAHAIGYNYRSIGIAAVGDFRRYAPPLDQYAKLVKLVAALVVINKGLIVAGHSDLPGAVGDSKKICPGAYLPVSVLAGQALTSLPTNCMKWTNTEAQGWLVSAGVTI